MESLTRNVVGLWSSDIILSEFSHALLVLVTCKTFNTKMDVLSNWHGCTVLTGEAITIGEVSKLV